MRKITTVAASMLLVFGASMLSASEMKCGAGKCGGSMKMEKKEKKQMSKCGDAKMKMKMEKKEKKKAMKCGVGKCGSK